MEDKNIIDFGEVTVPTSWNDINLKKFQDIERYMEAIKEDKFDLIKLLHIMIDKDKDYVMSLPAEFVDILLDKLSFIQTPFDKRPPSNKIVIKGETYQVNVMEKLKTGEWLALDTVMKSDKHNYAAMLAILCRKEGEIYDSKFEAEVLDDRVKMFENLPVIEAFKVVSFFLQLWMTLEVHSQLFTAAEEAINHIALSIENSHKIGAFKRMYLQWRIKNLRKSLKSNKITLQTHSHSLPTLFKKLKLKRKNRNSKNK